jgi:hypothetical protein
MRACRSRYWASCAGVRRFLKCANFIRSCSTVRMRQIYPHSQSHRPGFSRVGAGRGLWPWPRWCAAHSSTPCQWSVMRFVVGDRDRPAIAGGDPVGLPRVVGVMPLSRRLRLADPSAFGTHRCLRSTVEVDMETPERSIPHRGGAPLRTLVCARRFVTRTTHERGVGVRRAGAGWRIS